MFYVCLSFLSYMLLSTNLLLSLWPAAWTRRPRMKPRSEFWRSFCWSHGNATASQNPNDSKFDIIWCKNCLCTRTLICDSIQNVISFDMVPTVMICIRIYICIYIYVCVCVVFCIQTWSNVHTGRYFGMMEIDVYVVTPSTFREVSGWTWRY